eukprot:6210908-Pleurochrysis_carterae.AAC.1
MLGAKREVDFPTSMLSVQHGSVQAASCHALPVHCFVLMQSSTKMTDQALPAEAFEQRACGAS